MLILACFDRNSLANHAVNVPIRVVFLWFMFPVYEGMGMPSSTLPAASEVLLHMLISVALDDTWFYWSHRLLHHKSIYKYIHKQHHNFVITEGIAVDYAHPVEDLLSNTISTVIGPLVLRSHMCVAWLYTFMKVYQSVEAHSGYIVPFPLSVWSITWPGSVTIP